MPEARPAAPGPRGAAPPPEDAVAQALRQIGPLWASDIRHYSEVVKALYAPLLAAAPREGVRIHRDLPYGPAPRQVLDLFVPDPGSQGSQGLPQPVPGPQANGPAAALPPALPVVVFVHGGAFVRGAKCITADLYDNVLLWFARRGYLGVNVEYRLAPEAPYPQGALDVAAAVDWVRAHAPHWGGDPARIHAIGHSAGGTHVAAFLADPRVGRYGQGLASAALISARLRADVLPVNPNREGVAAYFGSEAAVLEAASPVTHAHRVVVPTCVVTAEFESPLLDVYGLEFATRLQAAGRVPCRHQVAAGHNHMSVVAHFNTGPQEVGEGLVGFFEGCARS